MMRTKSLFRVSILSMAMFLALSCVWQSMAGVAADQPSQKTIDQDLDTLFAKTKARFDKMAASPVLKSPRLTIVNNFFWKSLKTHQPWHSLIRTDKKGAVINEVIRIEGVSKEKRSVADQAWFGQVSKTMKENLNIVKIEKTGRYYLIWAAPIVTKVKGTETFLGAVVAHIDLWDCFDRFSNKTTTPFMIRILGRVTLYGHLWRDTIKYTEKRLTVPGIDKISVRYPRMVSEEAAMRAADSAAALEKARLDSIQAKTARDLAAKAAAAKKAKSRNAAIIAALSIIGLLILVVVAVMVVRSRKKPDDFGRQEDKDRFGNL